MFIGGLRPIAYTFLQDILDNIFLFNNIYKLQSRLLTDTDYIYNFIDAKINKVDKFR